MAYGVIANVEALTPRYVNASGAFDSGTRPTKDQVSAWMTQLSNLLDAALAAENFSVPIASTVTSAHSLASLFIEQMSGEFVTGVNGAGRFRDGSKALAKRSRMAIVGEELADYVSRIAVGLDNMGATRNEFGSLVPIGTNSAGDDIEPIFQRGYDWLISEA